LTHVDPTAAPGRGLEALRERVGRDGEEGFEALALILRTVSPGAPASWRIAFDPTLARGMAYYTGPIFEIAPAGFPHSIAGGGRYDEMVGKLLGQDVPATGFSIGFERVISLLMEREPRSGRGPKRVAIVFEEDKDDLVAVLAAARALRGEGLAVSVAPRARKLGGQLAALSSQGFDGFVLFDGTERPPIRWLADEAHRTGATDPA
jgi:histidyl-tRNA synthetase